MSWDAFKGYWSEKASEAKEAAVEVKNAIVGTAKCTAERYKDTTGIGDALSRFKQNLSEGFEIMDEYNPLKPLKDIFKDFTETIDTLYFSGPAQKATLAKALWNRIKDIGSFIDNATTTEGLTVSSLFGAVGKIVLPNWSYMARTATVSVVKGVSSAAVNEITENGSCDIAKTGNLKKYSDESKINSSVARTKTEQPQRAKEAPAPCNTSKFLAEAKSHSIPDNKPKKTTGKAAAGMIAKSSGITKAPASGSIGYYKDLNSSINKFWRQLYNQTKKFANYKPNKNYLINYYANTGLKKVFQDMYKVKPLEYKTKYMSLDEFLNANNKKYILS